MSFGDYKICTGCGCRTGVFYCSTCRDKYRGKLRALLVALEANEIDELIESSEKVFKKFGEIIKDNITERDNEIASLKIEKAAANYEIGRITKTGRVDG